MKLTIGIVLASILIIGLVDFSDATFLPCPPAPCQPPKPTKPTPKPTKAPTKPPPKPTKAPTKPPPKPTKPPVKPPPKPCNPLPCGPGGVACPGCPCRDDLCKELLKIVDTLEKKIKKCVCGEKFA